MSCPGSHQPGELLAARGHPARRAVGFLSEQVFGSARQRLLDASLQAMHTARQRERQSQRAALRRAIADNKVRSRNLVRSLEASDDPDQDLIRDINERRAEPLTHLGVPNANLYRNLLRTFARACLGLPGDTRTALGRTLAVCGEAGGASSARC